MAKTDRSSSGAGRAAPERRVRVALLGYRGCSAWISAGLLELFALANLAGRGVGGPRTHFAVRTIAPGERPVRAAHGVRLAAVAPRGPVDLVLVPPLWSERRADFERRLAEAEIGVVPVLQRVAARGAIVASACSGAAFLARAGLLDGRRATTCWWLAGWFAERFPDVMLEADRLVVRDGSCFTSAAGTAYLHLALELVEALAGRRVAAAAGRLALVEPRRGSQSPFLEGLDALRSAGAADPAMAELARWIEGRLHTPIAVSDLARRLRSSERTLHRHFRGAFGMPPTAYLQSRRIARAKRLLERGGVTLEEVVERCGYLDVASFRKLFARQVGMTPREFRLRFQGRRASAPGTREGG